ncbi:8553_t:CDS:2 [Diversispora eburnea]|uniref:8553_t:CDS:1 n=1 Tax=Diversispora eburnea TaxID=1213867 RepID=A0A9N8ZVK2_9GLOM|nr:8553_t:CDS:2 [Diversispora eburnea]
MGDDVKFGDIENDGCCSWSDGDGDDIKCEDGNKKYKKRKNGSGNLDFEKESRKSGRIIDVIEVKKDDFKQEV